MIRAAAIGLGAVALFLWMAEAAHAGRTMDIEELRLKLESARAQYKGRDAEAFGRAIDNAVATLRAQYGTQVPAVEAIKLLRKLSIPDSVAATVPSKPADATGAGRKEMLAGMSVEFTPDGFLLRASDRSIVTCFFWVGLAVLLSVLPFRLFPDLIRGWWTDAGLSFWLSSAFLAVWAAGALYMVWMGALGFLARFEFPNPVTAARSSPASENWGGRVGFDGANTTEPATGQ